MVSSTWFGPIAAPVPAGPSIAELADHHHHRETVRGEETTRQWVVGCREGFAGPNQNSV